MKQKKVKSLNKKLTFRVILIALAILMVTVVSSQVSSNASFWAATEESIEKSTTIAAKEVGNVFTQAETLLMAVTNTVRYLPYTDLQHMQNFLYSVRSAYPFVYEVYIGIAETNQYVDGSGYVPDESWVLTQRPYYIGAMGTTGIFYQDPYLSSTGEMYTSIAVRLNDSQGETMGVTVIDMEMVNLLDIIDNTTIPGTTAQAFLLDSQQRVLAHPNADFMPRVQAGTPVYVDFGSIGIVETEVINDGSGGAPRLARAIDHDGVEKYISTTTLPGSGWTFGFSVPVSDFAANLNTSSTLLLDAGIVVVALVGIFFAVRILLIRPLKPIEQIVNTASMLAVGKTPEPLNVVTDDELGVLADDFNEFIRSTKEQISVLSNVANGDLTTDVKAKSADDMLSNAINSMSGNTRGLISEITTSSLQVSEGAKQVSDGAAALAQGATEQAASIQQLSASISHISERTKANAQTAEKTSRLSATIKDSAEKGSHQMSDMISAVSEINEASKNIGKIMKTIDDIAFQTNILALNAAVEAARAGSHGKGFAVVAEEVRTLAAKSADAAKDTSAMIQNSMEKAQLGSRIAEETAASLSEIVSGINETSKLVSEITQSSEEQAEGISQINAGIDQVAQVVQQNSATAEQAAAASEHMSNQADALEHLILQFKLEGNSPAQIGAPALRLGAH